MVSQEIVDKIRAAQNAIIKLEKSEGECISHEELQALTWTVLEAFYQHMVIKEPLTGKDLERAQEVVKRWQEQQAAKEEVIK